MTELLFASAIVVVGTLIAVRTASVHEMHLGPADDTPQDPQAIVPGDDDGLGFTTVLEANSPRVRLHRTIRLGIGLVLVGAAVALTIIVVVRGLAIVWPRVFPPG